MPNHIRNRIALYGTPERINELITAFSTPHDRKPKEAHDGSYIYLHSETGEVGWLDAKTNQFERRGKDISIGVPDGFVQEFEEAFLHMPNFNKIIPMPESLNISSSSLGDLGYKLLFGGARELDFKSISQSQEQFKSLSEAHQREAVELGMKYHSNVKNHGHATWYSWSNANWGTKWNSYDCRRIDDTTFEFDTAWSGVPDLIGQMAKQFPDVHIVYKWSDEDTGSNCGHVAFSHGSFVEHPITNGSKEAYELAFELRPSSKENYKLVGESYEYAEDDE